MAPLFTYIGITCNIVVYRLCVDCVRIRYKNIVFLYKILKLRRVYHMSSFELNDLEQKMNELLDFDGIVLAVWGMKPNYNKEKFAVSFDIGIDLIFDLLSFTEYDFEEKTYEPNVSDIFIINTFYECLMNFSDMMVEYVGENEINIYVPVGDAYAQLEIRDIEYLTVTVTSYKKVAFCKGDKPVKIGIYDFDAMRYEKFPENFVKGDSKFYCFG